MNASFIYEINLLDSERFRGVDAYYQFLINGQEEKWDIWWEHQRTVRPKDILKKQRLISGFLDGSINLELFRPAVYKTGKLLGSEESFLANFYLGKQDFFDVLD